MKTFAAAIAACACLFGLSGPQASMSPRPQLPIPCWPNGLPMPSPLPWPQNPPCLVRGVK